MTKLHPHYSMNVTKAKQPFHAAYVGQNILMIEGELYGGTLCQVIAGGDIDEANRRAQLIADAWNATAQLRTNQYEQPDTPVMEDHDQ